MVVFDATTLIFLLDPDAKPPPDQAGQPVNHVQERIQYLIDTLSKDKQKIIVPTPALSELLVRAGDAGPGYLELLNTTTAFKVVDFDQRAAVEVAAATREAQKSGDKRSGSESTWAKIKFDRQIVAIAKVENAEIIYSDDADIARFAKDLGIRVFRIADLPLPPTEAQRNLPLDQGD